MQKTTLLIVFTCFNSLVYSQILGSVNGKNCLEPKDSNGCCQVAQSTDNGASIIECPWSEPMFVCKKAAQCILGITETCRAGWGNPLQVEKQDKVCKQPYWTTFTEERKQGVRKMNEWCASNGGILISVSNPACECLTGKMVNSRAYQIACKDYKKFENK